MSKPRCRKTYDGCKPRKRRREICCEVTPAMERDRAEQLLTELVPLLRSIRDTGTDQLLRFESHQILTVAGGWLDAVIDASQGQNSDIGRRLPDID